MIIINTIFQGFDQTINLILDETHERVYSAGQGVEQVTEIYFSKIRQLE